MAKTVNHAAIGASIASHALAYRDAMDTAASCRDAWNVHVLALHGEGVIVGRQGKCPIATAFVDALVNAKKPLAKGTADNYLRTLKKHVASGEPIIDWNPDRKGAKGKGKGAKGSKEFHTLLAAVFNHGEGETLKALCEDWEALLCADKGIHALIGDYLASEGYEIAAE